MLAKSVKTTGFFGVAVLSAGARDASICGFGVMAGCGAGCLVAICAAFQV